MGSLINALHEIAVIDGRVIATETSAIRNRLVSSVSNSFVHSIFETLPITTKDSRVFFRNTSFSEFYSLFKEGRATRALRVLTDADHIPPEAVEFFTRQSMFFPESKLVKGATIATELPELAGKTTAAELENVAKQSSKVRQALDVIGKKVSSGKFIGFTLIAGAAGLTVYELAERYRKELTGCFRYESVGGNIKVCKVIGLSCNNLENNVAACTDNQLEPGQRKKVCADDKTAIAHCEMCDSTITDEKDPNYIPTRRDIPVGVVYRCRKPDLREALADMLQNYVTTVADGVAEAVVGGSKIIKYLLYGVIGAIGLGVIFVIFRFFIRNGGGGGGGSGSRVNTIVL